MTDAEISRLQELEYTQMARDVISRYCHALDSYDFELLSRILADDVVFQRPPAAPLRGERVLAFFRGVLQNSLVRRKHFCTNLIMGVADSTGVTARSYFLALSHETGELSLAFGSYEFTVRMQRGTAAICALRVDPDVPMGPIRTMLEHRDTAPGS
jgi:hypothetical protein